MAEKIPRIVANVDVRQFKLDATDGYVLTRIDGRLAAKDLARDTGLPEFQVDRALEKLERLGVIERFDPNAPALAAPRERAKLPEFASIGSEPRYDPKELDEAVEIAADQKKRILDLYYRLEDMDHYTLLGVAKDADKKTIKRAYLELASVMHPDRYFRKHLGAFKGKLEALFGRLTEANDTLVDPAKRVEYDAYLTEVATTKGMEALFERAVEESRRAAANDAAAPSHESLPHVSRPSVAPEIACPTPPPAAPVISPADLQARREALAKRLLGGKSVRPFVAPPPPAAEVVNPLRYTSTDDAIDALKRRYEDRLDNATASQAKKYLKAAEESLAKNDIVAAASSLHIATKFAVDDGALAMRYQQVRAEADKLLCDSYTKQATYEERSQRWPEAARTWQKVAKIKVGDASANARAAHCLLKIEACDLHEAAEHAKVAVAAQPAVLDHHVTLAEIYLKAGKSASATRTAETGLALDPKNAVLLGIVKKAKGA